MPAVLEREPAIFEQWRRERREKSPEDYGAETLISQQADRGIDRAKDYVPSKPGFFEKKINEILREAQDKYKDSGAFRRFQNNIISFMNDNMPAIKRSGASVPKDFQQEILEDAKDFDTEGKIVSDLCSLFQDNYGFYYREPGQRRRRYCAAAERIRKIAKMLLSLI